MTNKIKLFKLCWECVTEGKTFIEAKSEDEAERIFLKSPTAYKNGACEIKYKLKTKEIKIKKL